MAPLFQAMHHGGQAGRHQEALDEVWLPRIMRGNEGYGLHKLGAFGMDLTALAGFFDPFWKRPSATVVVPAAQAIILGAVGFQLRALGRLREAVAPMRAALERAATQESWTNVAVAASNLSELLDVHNVFTQAVNLELRRLLEAVHAADLKQSEMPQQRASVPECFPTRDAFANAHELALCQDVLVEVLACNDPPKAQHANLLAHPAVAPVCDYVKSFLPHCIAATSLLVRRWAKTEVQLAIDGLKPNVVPE